MSATAHGWFEAHRARVERAIEVCRTREAWSPFIESPSRRHHPAGAGEAGRRRFEERLGRPFPLSLPGERGRIGAEVSPYTGRPLGIDYPDVDPDALYDAARRAIPDWAAAGPRARVGVCAEVLDRWSAAAFENAWATMHTAGQGFMLAFAGSGASSLDRGLEGLAHAWDAMRAVPERAEYARRFGPGEPVLLRKRYRLVPAGVAGVVACGSYPAWNAYPAILANLATGNPVVLKPHPGAVLPMAVAAEIGRATLEEAGFDPALLTLAVDTAERPIAEALLQRPDTAIIDFTGSARFGAWIEAHCGHAQVYTETAGCNAVVLESARDLDAVLDAVAHALCLFSSQMCTAPQNIFVPRNGVHTPDGPVPAQEVTDRLCAAVDALVADPARAAGLCGAIQSSTIVEEMARLRHQALERGRLLRRGDAYAHPDFGDARTATPLILAAQAAEREWYGREYFGPMAFVITADDREHALQCATRDARERGAIASYAYSTDEGWLDRVEDGFADAGASVGINLVRHRPIQFTAAFSDYHVTGLNPAGNACLTDLAFVTRRFRIVQSKREQAPDGPPHEE